MSLALQGSDYDNTGCGVFKGGGGTKLERFLPKNQDAKRKLLNFENWISGGLRSFQSFESHFFHLINKKIPQIETMA